jgi:isoquinoline 1-oxidoreductase alpha subunit
MPTRTFLVNGERVTVDTPDDVRVLWILRDVLGITGPKYGCGINVCKACTSHINGPDDEVTTIEGLPSTVGAVGAELHPMQEAWLERDVAQCGYCQPGQIMAAVALVRKVREEGRTITEADLDGIRNICRCGTYPRIREAIRTGEAKM